MSSSLERFVSLSFVSASLAYSGVAFAVSASVDAIFVLDSAEWLGGCKVE